MTERHFSIGDMARKTGTNIETIRYYERINMLPSPARSANNYRVYTESHLKQLRFIRRARALGFPLDHIRTLLNLATDTDQPCANVDHIVREHILDIESKIRDLHTLQNELSQLLGQCQRRNIGECKIIDALGADND